MPLLPNIPMKIGVMVTRAANHRNATGRKRNSSSPVNTHAARSTQSTTWWWTPNSRAGMSTRNEPAG